MDLRVRGRERERERETERERESERERERARERDRGGERCCDARSMVNDHNAASTSQILQNRAAS